MVVSGLGTLKGALVNQPELRLDTAEEIRTCVRNQKELWQKIPCLALRAEKNLTRYPEYSETWRYGYWYISFYFKIDLATGEILNSDDDNLATDDLIVRHLSSRFDLLDAQKNIDSLRREISYGYDVGVGYDKEAKERWQKPIRKTLKLEKNYTRKFSNEKIDELLEWLEA